MAPESIAPALRRTSFIRVARRIERFLAATTIQVAPGK